MENYMQMKMMANKELGKEVLPHILKRQSSANDNVKKFSPEKKVCLEQKTESGGKPSSNDNHFDDNSVEATEPYNIPKKVKRKDFVPSKEIQIENIPIFTSPDSSPMKVSVVSTKMTPIKHTKQISIIKRNLYIE
ncbi:unnamed protein product [Danaus chrysippus]|uniref:(African queen) hypothetical protein n=1 Tax=Danaus chrysippus TaxID=151541 RepID=A0A8J2QK15_9NEOP|nr:unnamed protein product [Danaus chrysippus]